MPPQERFSVERIAELARIELTAENRPQSNRDLDRILKFVAVLDELDLSDVEPFFGISETTTSATEAPIRADIASPSIPRDQILRNSPEEDGQFFQVPPVFD